MTPKLINLNPERRSFEIHPTSSIAFEIESEVQALKSTLKVFVQEMEAIVDGEFRNNFTGDIKTTGRGFEVTLDAPEDFIGFNDEVFVEVAISDEEENLLQDTYSYTTVVDVFSPSIVSFTPTDGEINIDPNVTVRFTVQNDRDIVRVPGKTISAVVTVNDGAPINAIIDGVFQSDFVGTIIESAIGTSTSVSVTLSSVILFESKDNVSIEIFASDEANNPVQGSTRFTILDFDAPVSEADIKGGSFNKPIRVNLSSNEPSIIYYTVDGKTPAIGGPLTFFGQSPIRGIPIFNEGVTQLRFFAVDESGISEISLDDNGAPLSPASVNTEVFKISSVLPTISLLNPETGNSFTSEELRTGERILNVRYMIIEAPEHSINRIEVSVNNGPFIDTESTLLDSTFLFTGLISGENSLRMRATDTSGNTGVDPNTNEMPELIVEVESARLFDFSVSFAPYQCPQFPFRNLSIRESHSDFIDTKTVVIIGLGRREEVLVPNSLGEEIITVNGEQILSGNDGSAINFKGADKDSRHFQVSSFPILENTLKIFLVKGGREIELDPEDYVANELTGRFVLDHPLRTNETLAVSYLSESDINHPQLFFSTQQGSLFKKHGLPSTQNTLSLGAQIAFENGATRLIAVQALPHEVDPDWSQTFNIGAGANGCLIKEEGYWIVPIPLEYRADVIAKASLHAKDASFVSERKERVIVTGEIEELTRDDVSTFNDIGIGKRALFIATNADATVERIISGERSTINNLYIGAAAAGKLSSFSTISEPISKKDLIGFDIVFPNKETKKVEKYTDLERLSEQGIMYVTPLSSGGRVFRGSTTIGSTDPIQGESSITRAVDFLSKNIRKSLEDRFVGSEIKDSALRALENEVNSTLSGYVTERVFASYSNIRVVVDKIEPRQVNVTFDIVPLFPLNKISLTVGVKIRL